jgi:hypothetical protein
MPSKFATFAVSLLIGAVSQIVQAAEPQLLPKEKPVAGRSQEDWSILWWQWAQSFDRDESPVADRTGEHCAAKQSGEVWFLAGTYGTRRTIRTCRVPAGKYLFFPLINYVVYPTSDGQPTCASVTRDAAEMTDNPAALVLEVDGQRFEGLLSHRLVPRQCFDMGAKAEPPYSAFPSAANGYYVMLRPLTSGTHTLNFGGALQSMQQAVTYTLEVE